MPTSSSKFVADVDANTITALLADLNGPSKEASESALRKLISFGSAMRQILESNAVDRYEGGGFSLGYITRIIDESDLSDGRIHAGLATVITGPGANIRRPAIRICEHLNDRASILVGALVQVLRNDKVGLNGQQVRVYAAEVLGRWKYSSLPVLDALTSALHDDYVDLRRAAAIALGDIGCKDPTVLNSLASALNDSDGNVLEESIRSLIRLGATTPLVTKALTNLVNRRNSLFCSEAIRALLALGSFDLNAVVAIQKVATSTFNFAEERPDGYGNDYEYWEQSKCDAESRHSRNKKYAKYALSKIPMNHLADSADLSVEYSEKDQQLLEWFKDVDLKEYRTHLQVFWCIGNIDRDGLQSCSTAIGYEKMAGLLKEWKAHFKEVPLSSTKPYLKNQCMEKVYLLFNKAPFYEQAWTADERDLELQIKEKVGKTERRRWTIKAKKAWHYVDRFLTIKSLLPTIVMPPASAQ